MKLEFFSIHRGRISSFFSEKFVKKITKNLDEVVPKIVKDFTKNLDECRLKNIFLDFLDFICYNKTIKRKEVKLK